MYQGPLYICADHGGFALKKRLLRYFKNELNIEVIDMGALAFDELDDFPDYVLRAAVTTVSTGGRLIACCGSGQGELMAANAVPGMRMGLGHSIEAAELLVKHNNANGLSLAGRVLTDDHAIAIVKKYLETTEFLGGKYERRNNKIKAFELDNILPS